ncbi:hypothetical protein MTO96_014248 [Rhipicephalus appendiculatus]
MWRREPAYGIRVQRGLFSWGAAYEGMHEKTYPLRSRLTSFLRQHYHIQYAAPFPAITRCGPRCVRGERADKRCSAGILKRHRQSSLPPEGNPVANDLARASGLRSSFSYRGRGYEFD